MNHNEYKTSNLDRTMKDTSMVEDQNARASCESKVICLFWHNYLTLSFLKICCKDGKCVCFCLPGFYELCTLGVSMCVYVLPWV